MTHQIQIHTISLIALTICLYIITYHTFKAEKATN